MLIFGLAPGSFGSVLMFETAYARSGGRRLLKLNFIYGFLIGRIPNDSNFLRPRTLMSILKFLVLMPSPKLISSAFYLNWKSSSTITNEQRTSPQEGKFLLKPALILCHFGFGGTLMSPVSGVTRLD